MLTADFVVGNAHGCQRRERATDHARQDLDLCGYKVCLGKSRGQSLTKKKLLLVGLNMSLVLSDSREPGLGTDSGGAAAIAGVGRLIALKVSCVFLVGHSIVFLSEEKPLTDIFFLTHYRLEPS